MNAGFRWVTPPEAQLIPNLEKYGQKVLVSLFAAASYWGQDVQNKARKSHTWEDRTGAARSGLFYAVDGFGFDPVIGELGKEGDPESKNTDVQIVEGSKDTLIIALAHTVFYGKFLETSNGENYAIIMSTMESNLPELESLVEGIFRG